MVIRPTGNSINMTVSNITNKLFSSFQYHLYETGTTALAATIITALKLKPYIKEPEVIIPAYACPDLISAIVYAKAKPVLVDLENNSPCMSLNQVHHSITNSTVAIIAVRFVSISEQIKQLSKIAKQFNLILIEDSAQGFPIKNMESYWHGDFIVISFGRGKPVNLLGGGAVLTHKPKLFKSLPTPSPTQDTIVNRIKYKIKLFLYNQSIRPFAYGLLTQVPGLNIGQTVYKPLNEIKSISSQVKSILNSNLIAYPTRKNCQQRYTKILKPYNNDFLIDLPNRLSHDMSQPLLRYPILIKDNLLRDELYENLKVYGASLMYQQPLNEINGVNRFLEQNGKQYPNAKKFSKQLLTLPTHEDVDNKILQIIDSTIKELNYRS